MKHEDWTTRALKPGDLIYMECLPGGMTIFLGHAGYGGKRNGLLYEVYHPELGRCKMPDYYFISLEDAAKLKYLKNGLTPE
tara:strand:- start:172 stop:414 length:243 start_codon:yes stop_codon:yes gene_type:complete